jgi:multiple antibiotic resistance protein
MGVQVQGGVYAYSEAVRLAIQMSLLTTGLTATLWIVSPYARVGRVIAILGATGKTVITQLSSFLLVCIGVQIAWNGIKALLESVTLHIG